MFILIKTNNHLQRQLCNIIVTSVGSLWKADTISQSYFNYFNSTSSAVKGIENLYLHKEN